MSKSKQTETGAKTDAIDNEALELVLVACEVDNIAITAEDAQVSFAGRVFSLAQKSNASLETWNKLKGRVQAFYRSNEGEKILKAHKVVLETTDKGERKLPRYFVQVWSNIGGGLKMGLNPAKFDNEQEYRQAAQDARKVANEAALRAGLTDEAIAELDHNEAIRAQASEDMQSIGKALRIADTDTLALLADTIHEAAAIATELLARVQHAKELEKTEKEQAKVAKAA